MQALKEKKKKFQQQNSPKLFFFLLFFMGAFKGEKLQKSVKDGGNKAMLQQRVGRKHLLYEY